MTHRLAFLAPALLVLTAALIVAAPGGVRAQTGSSPTPFWSDAPSVRVEKRPLARDFFVELAQRVRPAVIGVEAADGHLAADGWDMPLEPGEPGGMGSGFVISPDGYALTSQHVVEGLDEIAVRLADGTRRPARVLGGDDQLDVALLRIDSDTPLPHLALGDSGRVAVGQYVVALGNPYGLAGSFSTGIVSGVDRDLGFGDFDEFIQTDALVNPGSSGGPLLDLRGAVIGINTAIVATAYRVGFAVPIHRIRPHLFDLRDKGRIARGWIGVQVQELDSDLAESLGLGASTGVVVTGAVAGGPAAEAGLRPADVVLDFDGVAVASTRGLRRHVAHTAPGREVALTLRRADKTVRVNLVVAERGGETGAETPSVESALGIAVVELDEAHRAALGLPGSGGLLVQRVTPGSTADVAGLLAGDVIIEGETAPGQRGPLDSPDDLARVGETLDASGRALLLTWRATQARYVVLRK